MRRDTWLWIAGLSLAVIALGGLMLDLTPDGQTRLSWIISMAGAALLALAATVWLRRRRPPSAGATRRITARQRILAGYVLAALAVAGTAIGLAVASVGWQHSPGFAQLWLVPSRIAAARGPAASQATLGVRSGYTDPEAFHLVLRRGTSTIGTWNFTLAGGQSWQQAIATQAGQHLTAQLTTAGQPSVQTVGITSS